MRWRFIDANNGEETEARKAVIAKIDAWWKTFQGKTDQLSYIDLALADLDRGIKAVRKRLQEGNVLKRSWIQFFDADLAAEWVGIYDDSPPPPLTSMDE